MASWVLVTGGAHRLGREMSLAFARAGWSVACHYLRSAQAAETLCEEVRALGVSAMAVPGVGWLIAFFVLSVYAVMAVAFGTVDPILRTSVPQWNPLRLAEDFATMHNFSGGRGILGVGRGTVPRAYTYEFIRCFAPPLTRAVVEQALAAPAGRRWPRAWPPRTR